MRANKKTSKLSKGDELNAVRQVVMDKDVQENVSVSEELVAEYVVVEDVEDDQVPTDT